MLLLVGLACLFPLSLYCLFLALVHQRRTPTMLAGTWDFAGVILGLSGFLIVGTGVFLLSLNRHARAFFLEGGTLGDLQRAYRLGSATTFLLWALFYVMLAISFGFALWQRRFYTVIYHATPSEVEGILQLVIDRLRLPAMRRGPRWFIGYEPGAPTASATATLRPSGGADVALVQELDAPRKAIVDLEGSRALRYVSLHWRYATPTLRRELEDELGRNLANFAASEGGMAGWLMTATGSAFLLMVFFLATFLIITLR